MRDSTDRTVAAIFAAALLCVVLFLFNRWALFGAATCGLLVLGLALGFGLRGRPRVLYAGLLALLVSYAWLLWGIASFEPRGPLRLAGGVPAATALLIYGIWPMPLLAGLLYALIFRSSVLPDDKLENFLAKYGRRARGAPDSR